jgi:hypothetical protein
MKFIIGVRLRTTTAYDSVTKGSSRLSSHEMEEQ